MTRAAEEAQRRANKAASSVALVEAGCDSDGDAHGDGTPKSDALTVLAKETREFATWSAEPPPSDWEHYQAAAPEVAAYFSRRVCVVLHESVREAKALVHAVEAAVQRSEKELRKLLKAFGDGAVTGSSSGSGGSHWQ